MADTCAEDSWDIEAALANYDKALSLSADYAPALMGKAKLLGRQGQIEDAESLYAHCIATDPEYATSAHCGLGELHVALGNGFEAIAEFIAAHESAPDELEILDRLIQICKDFEMHNLVKEYSTKRTKLLQKNKRRKSK